LEVAQVPEGYDPRPFIQANRWVRAKVVADTDPHEYLVARNCTDPAECALMARWIRATGERRRYTFWGRTYTYEYAGPIDGWTYWVTRFRGGQLLVNRRHVDWPAPGFEAVTATPRPELPEGVHDTVDTLPAQGRLDL
jgi:hypothetical protein